MSVNILQRIFSRVLPAAGLISSESIVDLWETGDAFESLAATVGETFIQPQPVPCKRVRRR